MPTWPSFSLLWDLYVNNVIVVPLLLDNSFSGDKGVTGGYNIPFVSLVVKYHMQTQDSSLASSWCELEFFPLQKCIVL